MQIYPSTDLGPIPILHADAFEDSDNVTTLFTLSTRELLVDAEVCLAQYFKDRQPSSAASPTITHTQMFGRKRHLFEKAVSDNDKEDKEDKAAGAKRQRIGD